MISVFFKSLIHSGAVLLLVAVLGFAQPLASYAAEAEARTQAGFVGISLADAGEKAGEKAGAVSSEVATSDDEESDNDPLEGLNRFIFEFNEILQDVILRPVSKFYNENVNVTVRQGISNFLNNLSSPVTFVNDILQGELDRALTTFGRAFINTTLGMGGIADVAFELGIESHDEDFGQTLGVYGVGEGFYLVLPIFGPSNPRDAIGKLVVDSYFDPIGLWLDNTDQDEIIYSLMAAKGIDEYAGIVDELNQVKKTSVDYYAAVRSLYRQKRKAEINNGSTLELPPIPYLSYDITPEDVDQSLANVNQPSPVQ
jgi:phospholipid-binding lipoprotein MlaA